MKELAKIFIQKLHEFEYEFDADPRWDLIFSNGKRKWYYVIVTFYNGSYYITECLNDLGSIQITETGEVTADSSSFLSSRYTDEKVWGRTFELALPYLERVQQDWSKEYTLLVQKFPYRYRKGKIHNKIVRHYCKDIFRVDEALGKENVEKFISIVENKEINPFTAGKVKDLYPAESGLRKARII